MIMAAAIIILIGCVKDPAKLGIHPNTLYKGRVIEKSQNKPIKGVTVSVTDGSHVHTSQVTGDDGCFEFRVDFDAIDENYSLQLDCQGYTSIKEDLKGFGQESYDYKDIVYYDNSDPSNWPNVTTIDVSEITSTTAITGGTITYSGAADITARGVCWGTTHTPNIDGNHTTDGSGIGSFTSNLTNLSVNTTYFVRAYAINLHGTYYGEEKSFTTNDGSVVVTTNDVSNITPISATCGGIVTISSGNTFPITARGVCWATSHNPTIDNAHTSDGTGAGSFNSSITGLSVSTTYYVRAYATNEIGVYYGEEKTFSTIGGLPVVTTKPVTNITPISATGGGNVTADNGFNVTERGICWSTYENPTVDDNHKPAGSGLGEYNCGMTDLASNTTYYVRAYAINANGTSYGNNIPFTTAEGSITITTSDVTNITPISAMSGGNITLASGNTLPVTARGVCWSTNHNPTTDNSHTSDGTGSGSYTSSITGLTVNTTYYVRAYAVNELGIYYGAEKNFSTTIGLPVVTTKDITDIHPLSATSGGIVTSDNGFTVTSRGVCWSVVQNPTIDDSHTTNGTGMGEFNSFMETTQNSTTYHVRAYATNANGTAYGEDKLFTTTSGAITVTTNSVTGIGPSSATCGGNATLTSDNNLPITAKGVCWSTGHNPSISDSHTIDGTGNGTFTSTISGLSINTQYYVRAYATNQLGTYYGNEKSFTTTAGLPSVTTTEPILNETTVTTGGNVTSDGGYNVTARGICYGPLPNPDLTSTYQHTTDGSGTGYFSSTFSLPGGSGRYYIRAYATNANGTVYGEQKSIIQPYDELPTFLFNGITYRVAPNANNTFYWSDADAYCNNLTLYGYSDWRLPTKEELLQMYNDRVSIGNFVNYKYWSSTPTTYSHWYVDFSSGTPLCNNYGGGDQYSYYVRPIRQETSGGTAPVAPTVTTASPSGVTSSSATCGGNVTSDGGATVTQRGVCYSTSQNPTTSSQIVLGGSGTGLFTCSLSGLSSTTTYYVRAYATNSAGTAYGDQQSFTTSGGSGGGQTYSFTFEDGTEDWHQIDADGDGNTWFRRQTSGGGHNSDACVTSASFINDSKGALTPDNYLFTPLRYAVSNGASISFYVCAQDANWAAEHYGVAVATTSGNPTASDFTTIWEETLSAKTGLRGMDRGTSDQGTWYLKTIDLSTYAGQTIWIAIRHFNCTDQFMINIDDITITTSY